MPNEYICSPKSIITKSPTNYQLSRDIIGQMRLLAGVYSRRLISGGWFSSALLLISSRVHAPTHSSNTDLEVPANFTCGLL